MRYIFLFYLTAAGFIAGCAHEKVSDFIPVDGNFGYVTHVKGIDDQSVSAGLRYRDPDGSTREVWPSLMILQGKSLVVTNDTAVLIGGKALRYPNGAQRLSRRLIVFKGPTGPPMDITDQVLMKYYAGTGLGLSNYMWDTIGPLVKANDAIQIDFCTSKGMPGTDEFFPTAYGCQFTISWEEIGKIMADVKRTGKSKKEEWSGFDYLQKE